MSQKKRAELRARLAVRKAPAASRDPKFVEKLEDIAGRYVAPVARAGAVLR